MAINYELSAESMQSADCVFDTVVDLAQWDDYAGVRVRGPLRPVVVGDRIYAGVRVAGLHIQSAFRVEIVQPPDTNGAGRIEMLSCDGPVDGRIVGTVTRKPTGCTLCVAVHGKGRGTVRFLESPLTLILSRWLTHQSKHLLARAAAG